MADHSKWKGKNLSYMTPAMMHAMNMSRMQSQNNYKKKYNDEVKGKGFSGTETMDQNRAMKMTAEQSLLKYHNQFEKEKGKGFTSVSDTPEMNRIKGQQSFRDIQYKKDFFEQKGHNIPVVETPESIRIKQQQKFQSDVKYQEDRNKLRGKALQVTDDPQMRRAMQAAKIASDVEYKKTRDKQEEMERRRKDMAQNQQSKNQSVNVIQNTLKTSGVAPAKHPAFYTQNVVRSEPMKRWRRNPGSIFDYDPSEYETEQEYEDGKALYIKQPSYAKQQSFTDNEESDFDRVVSWRPEQNENKLTSWTDFITGKAYKHVAAPGSVMDYDPVQRMQNMSIQDKGREEPSYQPPAEPQCPTAKPAEPQEPQLVIEEPAQEITAERLKEGDGHRYKAMYDYAAADDDEVTFMDGDVIINAMKIDDGWMFGTVERTGQTGMLPANYVQVV